MPRLSVMSKGWSLSVRRRCKARASESAGDHGRWRSGSEDTSRDAAGNHAGDGEARCAAAGQGGDQARGGAPPAAGQQEQQALRHLQLLRLASTWTELTGVSSVANWLAKQAFPIMLSVIAAVGMLDSSAVTCLQAISGKLRHAHLQYHSLAVH